MHILQKLLIKRLVKNNGLSYGELALGYDAEDNINFHIKKLISEGIFVKQDNKYHITPVGINVRGTFKLLNLEDVQPKSFFAGFVCENNNEFLIKQHLNADPVFYNLPSGKPKFGESLKEQLSKLFYEETGVSLNYDRFIYNCLHMKTVKTPSGSVLFDDAFAIYNVSTTDEERSKMELQNNISWRTIEDIKSLDNKWLEIDLNIVEKQKISYLVYDVQSNYVVRKEEM